MKQGVLSSNRVRLLLHKGVSCYRQRRRGERKRKSVRGCIVAADLAVLNLVVVKRGEQDIPGLTDTPVPRRLGPKRANKIRKLFNLGKVRRLEAIHRVFRDMALVRDLKAPAGRGSGLARGILHVFRGFLRDDQAMTNWRSCPPSYRYWGCLHYFGENDSKSCLVKTVVYCCNKKKLPVVQDAVHQASDVQRKWDILSSLDNYLVTEELW